MPVSPQELATRIRDKVRELNEDLLLAAMQEVDIEFEIRQHPRLQKKCISTQLLVWCSQEV